MRRVAVNRRCFAVDDDGGVRPTLCGTCRQDAATDGRSVTVLMAGPLVLPAAASIVAVSLCQISSGDAHASLPAPVHGIGRYAAHTVRAFPPPCEKNHGC